MKTTETVGCSAAHQPDKANPRLLSKSTINSTTESISEHTSDHQFWQSTATEADPYVFEHLHDPVPSPGPWPVVRNHELAYWDTMVPVASDVGESEGA